MNIEGAGPSELWAGRYEVLSLISDSAASEFSAEWRYGVAVKETHLARDGQGPHLTLREQVGISPVN